MRKLQKHPFNFTALKSDKSSIRSFYPRRGISVVINIRDVGESLVAENLRESRISETRVECLKQQRRKTKVEGKSATAFRVRC